MEDRDDKKKGTGAGAAVGAAAGGVAGGAAAGAAAGGLTGPAGAVIGAAVGAVVGALGGRGAAGAKDAHDDDAARTEPSLHRDPGTTGHTLQTVIGAFDDRTAAERAATRLAESGFAREDIHIEHGTAQVGTAPQQETTAGGPGRGEFLPGLFGMHDGGGREHQARYHTYHEAVRRGSALVVVDAHDEAQAGRASALMHELGAVDLDERASQWRAEGWQAPPAAAGTGTRDGDTLEVVEEQLQVGKRSLDRGGVRVIQRVSSRPVRELVRLREEHAVVERHPVDRPVTGRDMGSFREGSLEIRETAEEPVVAKSARVVEEVRVGKEVREREQVVEDTVRRKDVDVERFDGGGTRDTAERERAVAADPRRTRDPDKPV